MGNAGQWNPDKKRHDLTPATRKPVVLLLVGVAGGLLLTWIDSRPGWDDTGVTAGGVFFLAAILGSVMPGFAWLWALAVGVWIPVFGILAQGNYGSLLALAIAFAGAYAGVLNRKMAAALNR